jgi:acyl-CoA thioester hydrolase
MPDTDTRVGFRPVETYRGFVYPWVMDHVGHMNVHSYVGRFDEASWHFLAQLGLTPSFLESNRRSFVAVDQRIQYKVEVVAGTLLHVTTELLEVRRKTIRWVHRMFNSETGSEVASMELVVAYFDTAARASTPLPDQVIAAAERLRSPASP